MILTYAVLVFAFVVKVNASELGSKPILGKVIGGIPLNPRCNILEQIGIILHLGNRKGVGVFISSKHFLTVAQCLFIQETNMVPKKISASCLEVGISASFSINGNAVTLSREPTFFRVLHVDTHPEYNPESFLNDIALLLVENNMSYELLEPDLHLQLPKQNVPRQTLDLIGFEDTYVDNKEFYITETLKVNLVSRSNCPESFKRFFNETNHLCGETEQTSTEKEDVGSLLVSHNYIVGLFIFVDENRRNESAYVNVFEQKAYIERAKEVFEGKALY